jgi:hypothetical protein
MKKIPYNSGQAPASTLASLRFSFLFLNDSVRSFLSFTRATLFGGATKRNARVWRGGQAALTTVIFFLAISLAIVAGSVQPVLSELRATKGLAASEAAWYLAEAGSEDTIYRLRQGFVVTSLTTTILGDLSSTIEIENVDVTHRTFTATGDIESYVRKVAVALASSSSFGYTWGIEKWRETE